MMLDYNFCNNIKTNIKTKQNIDPWLCFTDPWVSLDTTLGTEGGGK